MIGRDLRYAVGLMIRTPGFAIPAIVSIALGIAVNTTMFSVVNAVLLRPLGSSSEPLVRIGRSMNGDGSFRSVSYDEFEFLQRHANSFADVVGSELVSVALTEPGNQFVSAEIVTSSYFKVFGTAAAVGRGLGERAFDDMSMVVSDRFWRLYFNADPAIVGQSVTVNGLPFTVVGVLQSGFTGSFPGVATDVWLPANRADGVRPADPRALGSMDVVAALKPDVSLATARAELEVLSRRISQENSGRDPTRGFVAADARGIHPGLASRLGPIALGMLALFNVVLLIVCANVAGLVLARGTARRAELGVRLALGASRRQVIAQLLIESLVLAASGGVAGFLLSLWAVAAINARTLSAGPTGAPVFLNLALDARALAFTVVVTIFATIAFGLLPALEGTRIDLISALKDRQSAPDRRRSRWRSALVIFQVTVSVALMIGAVLFFRSVRNSARVDLGFDPDQVVVVSFNLQPLGYDRPAAQQFFDQLLRRARELPGVDRAAIAGFVPMGRGGSLTVADARAPRSLEQAGISAAYNSVTDDYFVAVGQPLVRGRGFTRQDRPGAPLVAIANETLARRLWPNEDAVGQRIRIVSEPGDPGVQREIVGVAKDARYTSFGAEVGPFLFLPTLEVFGRAETLHLRVVSNATTVLDQIKTLVREIDPNVIPDNSQTMRDAMSSAMVPAQIAQAVLGVSGVLALLLATGGLYGLVCYSLQQRMKEIGIRVALGASRASVFRLIVGSTVRLAVIGAAIGAALASAAMQLLASLLVGVSPSDPLTLAGVVALTVAVTLAAGYAAARHGLNVDPAIVLKHD